MPLPLISVVINTHNGEKFIKKSIKSALNQTYKNLEIIQKTQDMVIGIIMVKEIRKKLLFNFHRFLSIKIT